MKNLLTAATSRLTAATTAQFWSLGHDLGVDLGTTNLVLFDSDPDENGNHYPVQMPSVVAYHNGRQKTICVGQDAKNMIGRVGGDIMLVNPIGEGVVVDIDMTAALFRRALHMNKKVRLRNACRNFLIGIPLDTSNLHFHELQRVAFDHAKAERVFIAPQPMLAAIGAGLDVTRREAILVIDVGGGTTDIAVIAFGKVAYGTSIPYAGKKVDETLIAYAKKQGMILGTTRAEELKIKVSGANGSKPDTLYPVEGRSIKDGCSARLNLTLGEIDAVLRESNAEIKKSLVRVLTGAPELFAELAGDLMDTGVVLTGGGARLRGLPQMIEELGFSVKIADDPLLCVARGIGTCLSNPTLLDTVSINTMTSSEWARQKKGK